MTIYTIGVEAMIVYKMSEGQFTEPFPWYVKVIWVVIAVLLIYLISIAYANQQKKSELKAKEQTKVINPYNPDLDIV